MSRGFSIGRVEHSRPPARLFAGEDEAAVDEHQDDTTRMTIES
jgi:hypothetical protein